MADLNPWNDTEAPTLADFEELATAAWQRLPDNIRRMANELVIQVADFAPPELLDRLGINNPFELTGLYQGVSLDRKSTLDIPNGPDMVFLYRRPLLDEWSQGGLPLGDLITHVLIHEIGHHFGFSDEDMAAIETEAGL